MKTTLLIAAAAAAIAAAPASAVTITSFEADGSNHLATTPWNLTFSTGNTTQEAFDLGFTASLVGSASRTAVDPAGTSAGANVIAPRPNDGNGYFTIGGVTAQGQSSLTLTSNNGPLSAISVFIGTLDSYNMVQLLDTAGNVIGSAFDGAAMNNGNAPFRGAVVPANNRRVTFTADAGQTFGGIRFYNDGANEAFEVDNISFTSAIPEPATWAMMLVGFGMVGAAARYRRRASSVRFA